MTAKIITDPSELADLIEGADRLMIRLGGENSFHKLPDPEAALVVSALRALCSEAVEREAGLELGADMCIRMARSESSVGHDKEASILEAAAFGIRALKRHGVSPHSDTEESK